MPGLKEREERKIKNDRIQVIVIPSIFRPKLYPKEGFQHQIFSART